MLIRCCKTAGADFMNEKQCNDLEKESSCVAHSHLKSMKVAGLLRVKFETYV